MFNFGSRKGVKLYSSAVTKDLILMDKYMIDATKRWPHIVNQFVCCCLCYNIYVYTSHIVLSICICVNTVCIFFMVQVDLDVEIPHIISLGDTDKYEVGPQYYVSKLQFVTVNYPRNY